MRIILTILLIIIQVITVQADSTFFGNTILALYKSSDGQTEQENEIFFYLSQPLKEMGLNIVYWDIDRGMPGNSITQYARAVITWFRGPSMNNPDDYLNFLDQFFAAGKKVIVIDNFGAYQNRRTQEFILPTRLNTTLSKLGIMYFGDWLEDPNLIRFVTKDSSMVEFNGKQDMQISQFYYNFLKVDKNLKVYLSIERTDRDRDPSPIIVTNKNGGFALTRYIYRVEGGNVVMLLNLEKFIKEALFPKPDYERIALLADINDPEILIVFGFTKSSLERAKLPVDVIPVNQFKNLVPLDLRPYTVVGILLKTDSGLNPSVLESYLNGGGSVVSLVGGQFTSIKYWLGIGDNRTSLEDLEPRGYIIKEGFLLGEKISLSRPDGVWKTGHSIPASDVIILGTDYTQKFPIFWTCTRGNGKVLTWNWDAFFSGGFLGFILESFLYVRPVGVAGTPALGLMFIDDWPIPMYNVYRDALGMVDTEFYTQVWWPDIKNLFSKYNIPFSSYIIFNYNIETRPPFPTGEFYAGENLSSLKMAYELLDKGWEMGLHGYNHMSLTQKQTELNPHVWPSVESMEQALLNGREEWIRLFGEHTMPATYVAPHNIISEEGIKTLIKVFPTIKVISTVRAGAEGETPFDFGYHPTIPGVYMLPRTSCGCLFTPQEKQNIIASITGPGLWSHFIHPDDANDPIRSGGKSWEKMLEEFEEKIQFVQYHYPWLTYVPVIEGYRLMQQYDESAAEFQYKDKQLTIKTTPGLVFRIRLNGKTVKDIEGAEILYEYKTKSPGAIVIKAVSPEIDIEFY
jgi:hypothetical protein